MFSNLPSRIKVLALGSLTALSLGVASSTLSADAQTAADTTVVQLAAPLLGFRSVALDSTPAGLQEDNAVWLAKITGLMLGAPPLLTHSLLMSRTPGEFAGTIALLEQAHKARVLKEFEASARIARNPVGLTKTVGGNDLTYRPVAACRILDTRSAALGSGIRGPLAGNTAYNFKIYTATDFSAYGGAATNCNIPNSSTVDAIAFVVTIPSEGGRPTFDSFLGISDSAVLATVLGTVAVNFTHQQGISTMYIARANSSDNMYLAMPAGLSANVLVDVVGYYINSEVTALDCTTVTGVTNVADGTAGIATTAACAAGFNIMGGGCSWQGAALPTKLISESYPSGSTWICGGSNNVGAARDLTAYGRCCRIPGGSL